MAQAWTCTRDDVKLATDSKSTTRDDAQVDRVIGSATEAVEALTHRSFIPITATRLFDWPNYQYAPPWRLWLDSNELISVTAVTVAGVTLNPSDYTLRRSDDLNQPPYDRLELDTVSSATFSGATSHQQAVGITGLYMGCALAETQVGALTGAMGASGSAGIQLSPTVGVGSILRIDNERMIVTAKTMVDSGQNLGGAGLTMSAADVTVPVTAGTGYEVDEVLLIGAERMLIVDIAGNNLIVKRAWDGTVLAAHTAGVDIYALAGFTVDRAQLGTVAAAHNSGSTIWRHEVPGLIRNLTIAEALTALQQELAGYGRTVGGGENEREAAGRGLIHIRNDALQAFGRQGRVGAI